MAAPDGLVTLVFTDIQNSTEFWEKLQDRFKPVLDAHNATMRLCIGRRDGLEVKTEGDAFMIAFASAADAVKFAVDVQKELSVTPWPEGIGEVLVRIGMHTGRPILSVDAEGRPDYFGPPVNRAARVSAAAHGGQILISSAVRACCEVELDNAFSFLSHGEHRLKGLDRPENVFEVKHSQLGERTFPPIRTLNARRHNLPVLLSDVVGRDGEKAALKRTIRQSGGHTVTLLGITGVGKSTLALQTAAEMIEEFRDGVWVVDLEGCATDDLAVTTIASTLRLQLPAGDSPSDSLASYLADRNLLLILDNSESLPPGALLSRLLRSAPGTVFLLPRRTVLHLRGERIVEVPYLSVPAANERSLDAIRAHASVHLFAARASEASADFSLDDANAPAVAEICRRLDGHPMAIELAASRIRGLAAPEIVRRLEDRFKLLVSRDQNVPPRQRTLRQAVDWSYDLLDPAERAAVARLSIFQNGFWLEAAEDVTGHPDAPDVIQTLRDTSLLSARIVQDSTRYHMIGMVRDYASEKLRADGDFAAAAEAHAVHYTEMVERAAATLRTAGERDALQRLAFDLDNCRQARHWCREQRAFARLARLATAGGKVLRRLGLVAEALLWANDAVEAAGAVGGDGVRSALLARGGILSELRRRAEAETDLQESLRISRSDGDRGGEAAALNLLGTLRQATGDPEAARALFEESLALRETGRDPAGMAMVRHNLAWLDQTAGRLEEAERGYRAVLSARRQLPDVRGLAETLNNLGDVVRARGALGEAHTLFAESAVLWEALGDRLGAGLVHHNLGEVYRELHDDARAETELERAMTIFHEVGSPFEADSQALLQGIRSAR